MAINESSPVAEPGTGPEARIPLPLATGLGLQLAALVLPGVVLIPTIVFRGAGQPEDILLWAVFASVVICGLTTMLQAPPHRGVSVQATSSPRAPPAPPLRSASRRSVPAARPCSPPWCWRWRSCSSPSPPGSPCSGESSRPP